MTTIPVLDPVTDINDSDLVMVTNAQGLSYTINGAELEKRNKIIIASNTTVTGAPLKAGRCVRIYFSADITANDGNTVMQINYNNVNYYVKVPKDGALSNFVAHAVGNTYKYVQAHTTLEFLVVGDQQNGFQFVIIGNPVVISNSDYSIQADGSITYTSTATNRKYPIIERFVQSLSPNQTVDFHVADSKMYLLAESGSYATATFNLFMISTGASAERSIFKINGTNGSLQFVDSNTIRFTYEYQGGGDSCYFSLISLY